MTNPTPQQVLKASGELEDFSWEKLNRSLSRSLVSPELCSAIGQHISSHLPVECSTHDIRHAVHTYLKRKNRPAAVRYSLRESLMKLGPDGFAFEQYMAGLIKLLGYHTQTDQLIPGQCVTHEIDILANRDNEYHAMECKFHNAFGIKSDVKVALYVYARFIDLQEGFQSHRHQYDIRQGWLITNTKLSQDAFHYAQCKQLQVISWNAPENFALRDLALQHHYYPITSLNSLKRNTIVQLFDRKIVSASELLQAQPAMVADLPETEITIARHEAELLTNPATS